MRWERRFRTLDLDTGVGLGHRERHPRLQSGRLKKLMLQTIKWLSAE